MPEILPLLLHPLASPVAMIPLMCLYILSGGVAFFVFSVAHFIGKNISDEVVICYPIKILMGEMSVRQWAPNTGDRSK